MPRKKEKAIKESKSFTTVSTISMNEEQSEEEAVQHSESKEHGIVNGVDEATVNLWKSVIDLEKNRFSFFDQLFAKGYVVDSLEVPKPGIEEEEGNFIEAEPQDFINKTDYGRVVLKTKHVYTGNFEDWYFQGPGRYVWSDGTIYQGEFLDGVMHGKGSIHWPDGSVYQGEFYKGERAPGWNVYSTSEGYTYAGDWQNGLPHGKGRIWYDPSDDEADYYDGGWSSGLQHGFGTRQYGNGDRYIGEWENGVRCGIGTMIWLNERQVYKGQWAESAPNGQGKHMWYLERTDNHVFPSRHVYEGAWEHGKRHGIGKMIYPCGSLYEGRWREGQRDGKGIFINPGGSVVTGLFKAGSLIGGSDVPLHSPTYDCDFGGLLDYLITKFKMNRESMSVEEKGLAAVVKKFLGPIRQLYQRAGDLAHMWGNNGLYPYWMKEPMNSDKSSSSHRIPGHHEHESPIHMRAKTVKPNSADGVNPVTRLGLWLLLKDCTNVTKDVSLAYFDKHFTEAPSISFQTKHNPFEPVLLWQFLQCLVITSVAVYLEIPNGKRKRKLLEPKVGKSAEKKITTHEVGVQALSAETSFDKTKIPKKSNLVRSSINPKFHQRGAKSFSQTNDPKKTSHHLSTQNQRQSNISPGQDEEEASNEGDNIPEEEKKGQPEGINETETIESGNNEKAKHSKKSLSKLKVHLEIVSESSDESDDSILSHPEVQRKALDFSITQAFEKLLMEKFLPSLDNPLGKNLPKVPEPLPPLSDLFDAFQRQNGGKEWMTASEFMRNLLPQFSNPGNENPVYWHQSPEIIISQANFNLDELVAMLKEKFYSVAEEERLETVAEAMEDQLEDFLGEPNTNTKVMAKESLDGWKENEGLRDFVSDPLPFGEEDLLPEPFLWKESPKCIQTEKPTTNPSQNLTSADLISVLRSLYPKLVGKPNEINVHFDMIFCDWLWAVSMSAKMSSEREMRAKILESMPPPPDVQLSASAIVPEQEEASVERKSMRKSILPANNSPLPESTVSANAAPTKGKPNKGRTKGTHPERAATT